MIFYRIILDETGPALHILRPGGPPEVHRLTLHVLAMLVRDAAAALDAEVRRFQAR